jgi:thioredoxin reductase (NADPH)
VDPVILVAVDDHGASRAMVDELRRYAGDYRVESIPSGAAAIERVSSMRAAGEPIAMVLADVGLQQPDGIEVLARVRSVAPTAKRVLLLRWGLHPEQARAVGRAVALGAVDTVLTKPTGPRDEDFHATISEELGEWSWSTSPVVEAVRVVFEASSRVRAGEIRDVLERLGVPTGLYPVDSPIGQAIVAAAGARSAFPVVEVMGQTVLADPTNRDIATAFGVAVDVSETVFDVAVVGAGPAGLGAAVYAASEGLSTLVLEGEAFGGQAGTSSMIRNYLGFPRGISGRQLGRRALLQATYFGAAFDLARSATDLEPGRPHRLTLSDGATARAQVVILACGVRYRRLGVAPLEELVGAGVFYGAATNHARSLEGADVVVVGAGNSGGQAAVHLARHAARVTLVARGDTLSATMSAYLVDEIAASARIDVRTGTEIVAGGGDGQLEWLELAEHSSGARTRLAASGLFVLIGSETRTGWLPPAVQRDDHGFVLTGNDTDLTGWPLQRPPMALETSVPGVFAAGDVRANDVKRVAAAVGEGAVSIPMVHRYLADRRAHSNGPPGRAAP